MYNLKKLTCDLKLNYFKSKLSFLFKKNNKENTCYDYD